MIAKHADWCTIEHTPGITACRRVRGPNVPFQGGACVCADDPEDAPPCPFCGFVPFNRKPGK